jgi:ribosomal-protein-alanine N-acetyltransferase
METMEESASFQKVEAITLEVRESNEAARRLYESFGFTAEAIRKDYYRNPQEHAVIMWKR